MNGHKTRFSDSSLYDEVCVLCGATDGRDKGLNKPCPVETKISPSLISLRRDDGTVFGYECPECSHFWKVYQNEQHRWGCTLLDRQDENKNSYTYVRTCENHRDRPATHTIMACDFADAWGRTSYACQECADNHPKDEPYFWVDVIK